jgi:phenylacetate-CoA ligase
MNSFLSRAALRLHERLIGRHILARLEELNRIQWLSRDELLKLQRDKLLRLVEYANQYVPYYQRVFKEVGFQPDDLRQDLAHLNKIPILTKAIIRKNWDDLLTSEPEHRRRMSKLNTSGSTGEPLIFMQDSDFRDAVTADIQRNMGWAGWKLGDLQAVIWGARLNPTYWQMMRSYLIDWVWNRFQINAFVMTDKSMLAFAERMRRKKPRVLFGYPTSVHRFAQFVQRGPYRELTLDAIFTSAETLPPPVRVNIEETFRCKVFNRYASLDLGGIACECEAHTGLHISVENNYIEVLRDGKPAVPGDMGELIVTNLNNRGMPFIRYAIGDSGAWHTGGDCPCGRTAPMLKSIVGRSGESFQTRDGRTVWAGFTGVAWRCLAHPSIKKFQIVQKSLDSMVVRLVPEGNVPQMLLEEIGQAIHNAFGDNIVIKFEFMNEIPLLPSGKHQYAMSELNIG